jgi:site-specific recombinase XerD
MIVKFYLKRSEATEATAIFARICYHNLKLKYYPSLAIEPKYWNKKKMQVRTTFDEHAKINDKLTKVDTYAKETLTDYLNKYNGQVPRPEELKKLLDRRLNAPKVQKIDNTFLAYFDQFVKDSETGVRLNLSTKKPMTPTTVITYKGTLKILRDYAATKKVVDFNTIDLDFYMDFTEYLRGKCKLSANTIGKHIKIVKTVLNEATEAGINTNTAYKSKRFIVTKEDADNIYLNEQELTALWNLDLSKEPKLERVRDIFLLGCYTGLRFSDFSRLTHNHIKEGFIEITQQKTGDPIVIPLHERVKNILARYDGRIPPAISNQKTNEYLKDIAERVEMLHETTPITTSIKGQRVVKNTPKWKLVCTHTARRSFATNEYKAGISTLTIMAITGHKTETSFLKYIKVTRREQAEILQLEWQKRANSKLIPLTA